MRKLGAMTGRGPARMRAILVFAAATLFAGCDSDGQIEIVDNLAAIGLETLPARFCCEIPSGKSTRYVGAIEIDPFGQLAGEDVPFVETGLAITDVTPAGAVEFHWDGWFVATGGERPPTAIPNPPVPSAETLFQTEVDIGGFSNPHKNPLDPSPPQDLAYTLHLFVNSCDFQQVSFTLTVFEYRFVGVLPTGEPLFEILTRQIQTVTIVNDPSLCEEPPPPSDLIVFAKRENFSNGEIWTSDRAGKETRLTTDSFDDIDPTWSPGLDRIAFASNRANPLYYELCTMAANGSGIAPVTAFGSKWIDDPDWAPNGHEIAMTVGQPGQADTDLWIVDLDLPLGPANPRQLTSGIGRDISPSWSPDGREIVFVRNGDLLVVPADGSAAPATRVAQAFAAAVDWSSQGMLAYERYDPDLIATRIWKADAATGQNAVRVSDGVPGFADRTPAWSADGTEIAFVREESFVEVAPGEIHVMGADGSNPQPVDTGPGDDRDPDW